MTLSDLDVIARGDDFEDRAASYEFRPWQWAFLHALDGQAELRDIARARGVDIERALDFVHEGQAAGLVHVVSMTLDEYRRSIGMASPHAAVSAPPADTATRGDHFSATDTLGSYEHSVPAWMIEHDEAPASASHDLPAEHEEPAAEVHDEPMPEPAEPAYTWYSATPEHEEAVAEHHDEPVAEHHDEAVAEYHDEPVAEHHDEAVAEHHDEAVVEHHDDDRSSAAAAVADLVSSHAPEEHAAPVSFSFGNHSAGTVSTSNGHAASPSWEPLSLATSVEDASPAQTPDAAPLEAPAAVSHDVPRDESHDVSHDESHDESHDVPEGISIRLSTHSAATEHTEDFPEPSQEKGSISFSFSPEDSPRFDYTPVTTQAATPAHVAEAPSIPEVPAAAAQEAPAAHSVQHDDETPEPALQASQDATVSAVSATADIVGNLLSRALTFRIK
jgi:hypothetical protein